MNMHRNKNRAANNNAIDGFIAGKRGRRSPGLSSARIQPRSSDSMLTQQPRIIGDFGSAEGFYPKKPTYMPGSGSGSLRRRPQLPQPDSSIELELPESSAPPKRSRLRLLHRSLWQKKAVKFAAVILLVGVLGGGYFIGKGYLTAKGIFKGGGSSAALTGDISKLNGEGDGRINILLLGRGGENHSGSDLTDTILIASIDPIHKSAAILSVPRDLYVQTELDGATKINAVFANAKSRKIAEIGEGDKQRAEEAGFKALEEVIERTIGIPMHYHVIADFEGFKQAIDVVGGIKMHVSEPLYEEMDINGWKYILNVQPGLQEFDGERALAYSRSRYTSQRGDFSRSERQRAMLVALKDKVITLGTLGNPAKINQLMNAFGGRIKTNFTIDEMLRLYEIGQEINTSEIESIGLADPPNDYLTTTMLGGQSVVIPRAGVNDFKEIQNFIRNKLRDGYLENEDATIAIYNGTYIAGLAAQTAENLKSYGYRIGEVADAPTKGYQQTIIVDLREGSNMFTRKYLENRFRTTIRSGLPDSSIPEGSADFVIILGQNEISRLEN